MAPFPFDDWWPRLEAAGLLHAARERRWEKGATIFAQGDVYTDVVLLKAGLVKLSYETFEGKEWIKSFIADQGVFGSRLSQALGEPSAFSAICIEASRTLHIPHRLFAEACRRDGAFAQAVLAWSEGLALRKEERERDLLCISAEDRYRKFIGQQSALAARITQVEMARYLGVTPVALSRIKSRVLQPA